MDKKAGRTKQVDCIDIVDKYDSITDNIVIASVVLCIILGIIITIFDNIDHSLMIAASGLLCGIGGYFSSLRYIRARAFLSKSPPSVPTFMIRNLRFRISLFLIEHVFLFFGWMGEQVDAAWKNRRNYISAMRLLAFILPQSVQDRIFNPSHEEIVEDFLFNVRAKGRWARAWLLFCLAVRTLILVIDCLRAFVLDKLVWMLPAAFRRWWMGK